MNTDNKLFTRDAARSITLARDNFNCVICNKHDSPVAHHIIDRRLWPDGGYYTENMATLCEQCHILAEKTIISCDEIRRKAGIEKVILPPHLYDDCKYDKWANIILPNGMRTKGELFHDDSVQKILKDVHEVFVPYVKYPRTYHLPWSPGLTNDDRKMDQNDILESVDRVIIALKMDGENTTMYRDYIHARSIDSDHHESRSWVKQFHSQIKHDIPEGWRICGENLYAKHSIEYTDLPSYFLGFSIWDDKNHCLSWDETLDWFDLLGITPVTILYDGKLNVEAIDIVEEKLSKYPVQQEGYVIRAAFKFPYHTYRRCVGKYVRKGHIQTHGHWMRQAVVSNKLK